MPFGDTEHVPARPGQARALVAYHAERLKDRGLKAWANLVHDLVGEEADIGALPGILMPDAVEAGDLSEWPQDRVFNGIGWGMLHSDLAHPDRDLMVSFRSSPHGGVSHGHASQNDFAIQKGGRALICAGGLRFPQHGTPFHKEYSQQTVSHNCVLVNGEGQKFGDGKYNGQIVDFKTTDRFGYVRGDATPAYAGRLTKCQRSLLLIRPSVIVLVDELETDEPASWQWLLHAFGPFEVGESTFVSRRRDAILSGQLFASSPLTLSQTDDWVVEPDAGFTDFDRPLPDKRWHFTAQTKENVNRLRIASIMTCWMEGETEPEIEWTQEASRISLRYESEAVHIDLEQGESLIWAEA